MRVCVSSTWSTLRSLDPNNEMNLRMSVLLHAHVPSRNWMEGGRCRLTDIAHDEIFTWVGRTLVRHSHRHVIVAKMCDSVSPSTPKEYSSGIGWLAVYYKDGYIRVEQADTRRINAWMYKYVDRWMSICEYFGKVSSTWELCPQRSQSSIHLFNKGFLFNAF